MIAKKDSSIRIYFTLIRLNAVTIDDGQPISNIKELMDTITRIKFYSIHFRI